jgi:Sulfotransferase domain
LTWLHSNVTVRARAGSARRAVVSPFAGIERLRPPLIIHASHHKVGTVWFGNVLRDVSARYRLRFREIDGAGPISPGCDVAFYSHAGNVTWDSLDMSHTRVSHLVRDLRDMAVSAYFYHRRSGEEWLHRPVAELGGRTYQEHLCSLPEDEGLSEEIRRMARFQLPELVGWPYGRPGVLELSYEDVLADEETAFKRLFSHYGFMSRAVAEATAAAMKFSLSAGGRVAGNGHVRSGRPGEWREVFTDDHVDLFKDLMGEALVQLGYERSGTWSR